MTKRNQDLFQDLTPEETAELLENLELGTPSDEDAAAIAHIQERVMAEANKQRRPLLIFRFSKAAAAFVACLAVIILSLVIWHYSAPKVGRIDEDSHISAEHTTIISQTDSIVSTSTPHGIQTTHTVAVQTEITDDAYILTSAVKGGTTIPQTISAVTNPTQTAATSSASTAHSVTTSPITSRTSAQMQSSRITTSTIITRRTTFPPPQSNPSTYPSVPTHAQSIISTHNYTTRAGVIGGGGGNTPGEDATDKNNTDSPQSETNPSSGQMTTDCPPWSETTTTTTTTGTTYNNMAFAADINHDGILSVADSILLTKERQFPYHELQFLLRSLCFNHIQ